MDEERRKYGGLSERQFETLRIKLKAELKAELKEEIWNDIYAAIGQTIVKRLLWLGGSIVAAIVAWFAGAGHIKLP